MGVRSESTSGEIMFSVYVFVACYAILFLIFGMVPIETDSSVPAIFATIVVVAFLMTIVVLCLKYLAIGLIFLLGA